MQLAQLGACTLALGPQRRVMPLLVCAARCADDGIHIGRDGCGSAIQRAELVDDGGGHAELLAKALQRGLEATHAALELRGSCVE